VDTWQYGKSCEWTDSENNQSAIPAMQKEVMGRGRAVGTLSSDTKRILEAVQEILDPSNPTTVRFVLYKLVSNGVLENTNKENDCNLGEIAPFDYSPEELVELSEDAKGGAVGWNYSSEALQRTISFSDGPSNTLYFSTNLANITGLQTTDYVVVNGATYGAGNSILGIKAWDVNSNSGTIGGLTRSNYPGRLSTPTINLAGAALTPGTAQRAEVILGRALGPDAESIKSGIWYGGPDQAFAQSNLQYNVQIVNAQDVKGDKTLDMAT